MRKVLIILIGLLVLTLFPLTSAVIVDENTFIALDDEIYTFDHEMNFSQIIIGSNYLILNYTNFTIDSDDYLNITINELTNNETINVSINSSSPPCTVWFNVTVQPSNNYSVYLNSSFNNTAVADANGNLSFTLIHDYGNQTILVMGTTTQVRITAGGDRPNVVGISETIISIVGVALVVGALMIIVFAIKMGLIK